MTEGQQENQERHKQETKFIEYGTNYIGTYRTDVQNTMFFSNVKVMQQIWENIISLVVNFNDKFSESWHIYIFRQHNCKQKKGSIKI